MSTRFHWRKLLLVVAVFSLAAAPALASHQWGTYHWARKSNPFTLKIHDNVHDTAAGAWDVYLIEAAEDATAQAPGYWNNSTHLRTDLFPNSPLSSVKRCTSTTGQIEVCSAKYGRTGWLGVAGIWASGDHITKAYTKVNDTYFETASYNTPAWRRMVMCQEIGHDFGLDHQDETFDNANLGTCMDYTNDPDGGAGGASSSDPSNEYPGGAHSDYTMLDEIYAHTDGTTTITAIGAMTAAASRPPTIEEIMADAGQFGTPIRFDPQGRPNLFAMPVGVNHAGEPVTHFTHVFWAPVDPFADREDLVEQPGLDN